MNENIKDHPGLQTSREDFLKQLERELYCAARYSYDVCLAFYGLDSLQISREDLSEKEKKSIVRDMVKLIRENIRRSDIFTHYDEERAALILPHTDYEGGSDLSGRLHSLLENNLPPIELPDGETESIRIKVGLAEFNGENCKSLDDERVYRLIDHANNALQTARDDSGVSVEKRQFPRESTGDIKVSLHQNNKTYEADVVDVSRNYNEPNAPVIGLQLSVDEKLDGEENIRINADDDDLNLRDPEGEIRWVDEHLTYPGGFVGVELKNR